MSLFYEFSTFYCFRNNINDLGVQTYVSVDNMHQFSPLLSSHWNQQDSGRLSTPLRTLKPAGRLTKAPSTSSTSANTRHKQRHQAGPAHPRPAAQALESGGSEGARGDSLATVRNKLRMKWKEMESSLNPTDSWQITSSTFLTGGGDKT